ncbi:MAG: radical SAM protein [Candidatus Aminicenantes bacterium]|nr:radical SAM protein [Candidatus Aminicenantes bacterium]
MSSTCELATGMDQIQFWRALQTRINQDRIPFSGSLALTHRCNLYCVHCYAREMNPSSPELSRDHWLRIIDDIKDAGCLHLLLTGGEPLLHRDFKRIYTYAKQNGFLVTVFSNGTRVDAAILDLFSELPPYQVEISVYGASSAVHERVTGVPGSFEQTRRGIEQLLAKGIRLRLKSVLMTLNHGEFPAMEEWAASLGVRFRFDAAIFPAISGDRSPLELRVAPERAVELEMSKTERMRSWHEFLDQFRGHKTSQNLYDCGSGINTFHVDPHGWLYPCLMVRHTRYSLLSGNFRDGWANAFNAFRQTVAPAGMPCSNCDQKLLCGYCPGFFLLENGSETIPSPYICKIGKLRSEKLYPDKQKGNS